MSKLCIFIQKLSTLFRALSIFIMKFPKWGLMRAKIYSLLKLLHWLYYLNMEEDVKCTSFTDRYCGRESAKKKTNGKMANRMCVKKSMKSPYLLHNASRNGEDGKNITHTTNQQFESIKHKSRTLCERQQCHTNKINFSIYWHAYSLHI